MSFSKARVLQMAKGYTGRNKNVYRVAVARVEKGLQYAFSGRKMKKRENRSNWIQQLNASCRAHDLKYSNFIRGLSVANIMLDRKSLADLAISEPLSFHSILQYVKDMKIEEKRIAQHQANLEEKRKEAAGFATFKKTQEPQLSLKEEARLAENLQKVNKQLQKSQRSLTEETKRLEKLLSKVSSPSASSASSTNAGSTTS